jgi:hypothetical protein
MRMMQFPYYPELFKAHPQRFRAQLIYVAESDEPPFVKRMRELDGRSRVLAKEQEPLSIELPMAFTQILGVQIQVLITSGFGEHLIHCEKVANNRHKICLKASPSYVCYVSAEELQRIEHWCKRVNREFARS